MERVYSKQQTHPVCLLHTFLLNQQFLQFFKFVSSKGHGQIVKTAVLVEVYRVIPIEAYVHAHNIVSCKILSKQQKVSVNESISTDDASKWRADCSNDSMICPSYMKCFNGQCYR